MIARLVGIPVINGERYVDMVDRSHDGIHSVRGDSYIELNIMMLEENIAEMSAIVLAASTSSITEPFVDPREYSPCSYAPSDVSSEEENDEYEELSGSNKEG
jgi:hypothetical protein